MWYLSEVIGDGVTPETAFRPAVTEYTTEWRAVDGRADQTKSDGYMLVECAELILPPRETRIIPADKDAIRKVGLVPPSDITEKEAVSLLARELLRQSKPGQVVRTKL